MTTQRWIPLGALALAGGLAFAASFAWDGAARDLPAPPLASFDDLPAPRVAIETGRAGIPAFLACLRARNVTLVSAHRGGPVPGYPENALETLARTMSIGPMLLEIDVAASRDGTLFLMHDDTLERTTTGDGPLRSQSWASIRGLMLEDNDGRRTAFNPPRLTDVLAWADGRAIVQLDVKRATPLEAVIEAIRDSGAHGHALIIVYSVEDAARVHRLDPAIMLSVSVDEADDLEALDDAGVRLDRIMAWQGLRALQPALIMALHERAIPVNFGTLWQIDEAIAERNADTLYARIADLGVDILATDRHEEAYAALNARTDTVAGVTACSAD